LQLDFAPEDLALATIPGVSFDPRERAFSIDELRPQPIIRKRKKVISTYFFMYAWPGRAEAHS
jgi:hypothetical protein